MGASSAVWRFIGAWQFVPSVIISTVVLNWLCVEVFGWHGDGYLGVYFLMWFPVIGLLETVIVFMAWKLTRGRDFG